MCIDASCAAQEVTETVEIESIQTRWWWLYFVSALRSPKEKVIARAHKRNADQENQQTLRCFFCKWH